MNKPTCPASITRSGRLASVALAVCVAQALALAANAQTAPAPTVSGGLEEIVVTAQKRAQNSQEVGIAISAVSGDELNALGAASASDITKMMPAVVLTQPNGPSSFSLSIRGVTQNDFADHQESPAAIYVDDVYVSQMAGLAFSMFDMERVEVLRGPQGTLFGRNATGGLANFVTRRPTADVNGYTDVTFGQRNLMRIEGGVGGAIADGIDGRFSYLSNHYDPLFHNLSGGAPDSENGNDWGLRGQLLFKDVAGGELLLNVRFSREDVHAGAWEQYAILPGANGLNTLAGPQDNAWGTCAGCNASGLPSSAPFTTRDNQAGYARIKTSGGTVKYTHDLSGATFTAIADYSTLKKEYQEDSDTTPYTIFQFFNGSDVKQKSLELRLNGGDKTLNWTAGLYGLNIDGQYYEGWQGPAFFGANEFNVDGIPAYGIGSNPNAIISSNPNSAYGMYSVAAGAWPYSPTPYPYAMDGSQGFGPGFVVGGASAAPNGGMPATIAPYTLVTKSYAAFGQLEYRMSDLIGLTVGARITKDQKDYNYSWHPYEYFPQSTTGETLTLTRPPSALGDYTSSRSDTLWAGKAQVDFHVAPDALLYLSYNRGVKGGGFTAPLFPATIAAVSALTFKPEVLTSYEAGFKTEFLQHTVRLNGAVYYYDYKDYQALIYTVSLNQLIVNADAKHKGAELDMEWAPNEYWRVGVGASYVDAIVKDVAALCCSSEGTAIRHDYIPPNAPKVSGNAMVRYTQPIGAGAHLAMQVDGVYLSRFWFNLGDAPSVEQPAYGVANARVTYVPAGGKFEVGVAVENLANKHYGSMGFDNTGVNGLAQRYPGMPRWVKAHVNFKF
ncbi:MAG: TonB-dependent receptor [Pseudomonadota bacterium]